MIMHQSEEEEKRVTKTLSFRLLLSLLGNFLCLF